VGNNLTQVFKTPSVSFSLAMEPSYNIGPLDEDNALYATFSGFGTLNARSGCVRQLRGNLAGTLGCGCMAYGHTSPTRMLWFFGANLSRVVDVAAVWGTWSARLNKSLSDR
jgi:hypothetical protein